jgi:two-component system cell cycle response regulator
MADRTQAPVAGFRRFPEPQGDGTRVPAPPRILVVDDNEQNLELLEAYLEELDAVIWTAQDGVEALKLVKQQAPDLILLDIMMPRMSGYQLCTRLKADPATAKIPVIMVTALHEVADMERARDCGAEDFLTKPVHKPDLLAKVRAKLGR